MKLIDILTSPWAIMPEKLSEIQAVYATHLKGEKIDLEALEAKLGRPLANEQKGYEVKEGGVAHLEISGVIANKANMFTKVSGGASAQMLESQVKSMQADPSVRSVVLEFDSPGGNVLGIPALSNAIRALAAEKPTVAVSTGTMASAAYWLASAADKIYISGLTDFVGSIGVVATHQYSPKEGAQTTEITAGKYKRMGSDNEPLSDEGRAYIQAQVDEIYRVFVETVAENRGVDVETVLAKMADGRIFVGQQAIDNGLVDGVATVADLIASMADNPDQMRKRVVSPKNVEVGVASAAVPSFTKGIAMDHKEIAAQIEAEHPEVAALFRAEGRQAERDRIAEVRAQAIPGYEALIEKLAFDGETTGPVAAMQILAAERERIAAVGNARLSDVLSPVASEEAPVDKPEFVSANGYAMKADRAELDAKAKAYMAQNPGVEYLAAIKAVSA